MKQLEDLHRPLKHWTQKKPFLLLFTNSCELSQFAVHTHKSGCADVHGAKLVRHAKPQSLTSQWSGLKEMCWRTMPTHLLCSVSFFKNLEEGGGTNLYLLLISTAALSFTKLQFSSTHLHSSVNISPFLVALLEHAVQPAHTHTASHAGRPAHTLITGLVCVCSLPHNSRGVSTSVFSACGAIVSEPPRSVSQSVCMTPPHSKSPVCVF